MNKNISLIGVPSDIGAGDRGATMGPEALRIAGIESELTNLGFNVKDTGNLFGPKNPERPPEDGYRHLRENVIWCQNIQEAVFTEINDGRLPIMLGGDHAMSIGSIAAVSRYCAAHDKKLCVIWIDAHSDFNTADISPSGNIHGMPVAVAAGYGPKELLAIGHNVPMVAAADIYQVGIRSVDIAEKLLVTDAGVVVYDMRCIDEIGMREAMVQVLSDVTEKDAHIHVSFDVDSLDPTIAPGVGTTIPGGLTYREAQLCMEMIHDSGRMISLDLMEINPALDFQNSTAKLAIELTASLFGRQIFSPNTHNRKK
ncbi:MAG: arginase [Emcibacter sp.]|nr:arginase [Emcibacter sp.]MBL4895179.1 arginase [Emcibacter sp.]